MSIVVRRAEKSDLEQVSKLFNAYRRFYEQPDDNQLAVSFIEDRLNQQDSVIFIAIDEAQQAVGFCQIYPTFCSVIAARIGVLYDLFVSPSSRKTGAGKALMLAAHEYANKNGFARLDLTTAKTNVAAQALYEQLGWVRDEVFYTYNKTLQR